MMAVLVCVIGLFTTVFGSEAKRAIQLAREIEDVQTLIGEKRIELDELRDQQNEREADRDLKLVIIEDLKKETGDLYEKPNTKDRRRRDLLVKLQQRRNTVMKGGDLIQWTNLCGSELTRQGKGSHCSHDTVTQDGAVQKYGVNSRMKNRHFLRRIEMAEPGMIAEQDESETISKNEEITEKERALQESMEQMREIEGELREYDVSLDELDAEIERLELKVDDKEQSLLEVVESVVFSLCTQVAKGHVLFRIYGRPHMIDDVFDAIMNDLYSGQDPTFKSAVAQALLSHKHDWGWVTSLTFRLSHCSTETAYKMLLCFDHLSHILSQLGSIPSDWNVRTLLHRTTGVLYALDIRGGATEQEGRPDKRSLVLGSDFNEAEEEYLKKRDNKLIPDEYRALVEQHRLMGTDQVITSDNVQYDSTLDLMDELVRTHRSFQVQRDPYFEQVFKQTAMNPFEHKEYAEIILFSDLGLDDRCVRVEEFCEQNHCDFTIACCVDAYTIAYFDLLKGRDEKAAGMIQRLRKNDRYHQLLSPVWHEYGLAFIIHSIDRLQRMPSEFGNWKQDSMIELIRETGRYLCGEWDVSKYEHPNIIAEMCQYYDTIGQKDRALLEYAKIKDHSRLSQRWIDFFKSFKERIDQGELRRAKRKWDRYKDGSEMTELEKRKMRVIKLWKSANEARTNKKYDATIATEILSELNHQIQEWQKADMDDSHPRWMFDLKRETSKFAQWIDDQNKMKILSKKTKKKLKHKGKK